MTVDFVPIILRRAVRTIVRRSDVGPSSAFDHG